MGDTSTRCAGLHGTHECRVDPIRFLDLRVVPREKCEEALDAVESSKTGFAQAQRLKLTRSRKGGDRTDESRMEALPWSAHRPRPSGRAPSASRGPVVRASSASRLVVSGN